VPEQRTRSEVPPKAHVRLRRWALASLVVALVAALLETSLAEDSWLSMLILHFPQWPFVVVPLFVGLWAVRNRDRPAVWLALAGVLLGIHLCAPCWRGLLPDNGPAEEAQAVRVITFNVQGCRGGPNRIAAMLRKENPDIVAFQEATFLSDQSPSGKTVTDSLPGFSWYRHGNLAIASRWRIDKSWAADFKTPTHNWAIFAEVHREGSPERPILVGAVHLNPVRWDQFVSAEIGKLPDHLRTTGRIRERQADELIRELEKVGPRVPTILCGDFNGPPRGKVYDRLTRKLNDSFAESTVGLGWTIPSVLPMTRIDYLFVGRTSTTVRSRVLADAGSDHRPLLAEIVL
jgi:endonuclease/exonuclease/phosphatase (EEP) superfamily protein YafD